MQGAERTRACQSRVKEAPDVAALRTLYQDWVDAIQNRDPAASSLHTQRWGQNLVTRLYLEFLKI